MPSVRLAAFSILIVAAFPSGAAAQDLLYGFIENGVNFAGTTVSSAGDLDQDGVPDVAYRDQGPSNFGRLRVMSGRTGGVLREFHGTSSNFSADPNSMYLDRSSTMAGDIDHDGVADVVIGHPGWFNARGRVRVLSGSTGSVLFEFSGTVPNEYFGQAIAYVDVDANGTPDYVIGSRNSPTNSGRVTVISGVNGSLLYEVFGDAGGDSFGLSVAPTGDVDHDGRDDFIVGSARDYSNPGDWGSGYVYSGATGQRIHYFPNYCSYAVAGAGDVNGDGYRDLVTGNPHDSLPGRYGCGSVSVYSGLDGSVLFRAYGDIVGDNLGWSVAGAGDANGDGFADVIAGTQRNSMSTVEAPGKARVYSGIDGSTLHTYHGFAVQDEFGFAVAGLGDLNMDGRDDVVIGAPRWLGRVLVYLSGVPAAELYCVAKINSLGCYPSMAVDGAASLSVGDNFVIRTANVLNQRAGKFIWSLNRAAVPFGGGTLCLGSGIVRTPTISAGGSALPLNDCSGSYEFHFSQAYITAGGLQAGTTVHAQFWSRDGGFPHPNNMGLTSGVSFLVVP